MSIEDTGDFTVPSSPADQKKIKNALHEIVAQLSMIDGYKENIKNIQATLKEEFKMSPKISAKIAKTLHKQEFDKVTQESEVFEDTFVKLFQMNATDTSEDEPEEE